MRKPDFFIVGAPKSGTTAMADYLGQHPDIFMPENKDSNTFGSDLLFDHNVNHTAGQVSRRLRYVSLLVHARND